jgi:hypothetical protein
MVSHPSVEWKGSGVEVELAPVGVPNAEQGEIPVTYNGLCLQHLVDPCAIVRGAGVPADPELGILLEVVV